MRNGPGTETLKQQQKATHHSSAFVILCRFERSGTYQATDDETVKTQPKHITNDWQCFKGIEELQRWNW